MKPILPVSQSWIRKITDIQSVFQCFTPFTGVDNFDHQYLGKHIEMLGMFGHFITIQFDGNYFLVPSKLVQYVIWSFETNLVSQFSDEDLMSICGCSNRGKILENLKFEMDDLYKTFQHQSAGTKDVKSKFDQSIDDFMESTKHLEPPAYMFEEMNVGVRS